MTNNYPAALAAMHAAVREHCPGLPAFKVALQFEDEEGGHTFSREHPVGPAPIHVPGSTAVIQAAPAHGVLGTFNEQPKEPR
jgi:hypothetical protein